MTSFDEAVASTAAPKKSLGRAFVIDLTLDRMEKDGRLEDRDKLISALNDPYFAPRRLSLIIEKMGYRGSKGAVENWRDRYVPDWRERNPHRGL